MTTFCIAFYESYLATTWSEGQGRKEALVRVT
jgi:hypothetical protein